MVAANNQSLRALKAEHERRTGCVENLRVYGWTAGKFSRRTGGPLEFTKLFVDWAVMYRLSRDVGGMWYISAHSGVPMLVRGRPVYPTRAIDAPKFPGPLAAALWLAVERPDGRIQFDQS